MTAASIAMLKIFKHAKSPSKRIMYNVKKKLWFIALGATFIIATAISIAAFSSLDWPLFWAPATPLLYTSPAALPEHDRNPLFYSTRRFLEAVETHCRAPPVLGTTVRESSLPCHRFLRSLWYKGADLERERGTCKDENGTMFLHGFWDGALIEKPLISIKSFVCTQTNPCYRLIVWTLGMKDLEAFIDESLVGNGVMDGKIVKNLHGGDVEDIEAFGGKVIFRSLTKEYFGDNNATIGKFRETMLFSSVEFSDLVRVLVLNLYGGFYIDLDVILLRSLTPLLELPMEFGYRWSFHDYMNTALLRLYKNSTNSNLFLNSKEGYHPKTLSDLCKHDPECSSSFIQLPTAFFDGAWNFFDHAWRGPTEPFTPKWLNPWRNFFTVTPPQEWLRSINADEGAVDSNYDGKMRPRPLFTRVFEGAWAFHFHNQWRTPISGSSLAAIYREELNQCIG